MSNLAAFKKLAEFNELTVDYTKEDGFVSLDVWAPKGKILGSSGCHCDCSFNNCTTPSGQAIDWPAAYKILQEVVSDGFLPCDNGDDCEYCND